MRLNVFPLMFINESSSSMYPFMPFARFFFIGICVHWASNSRKSKGVFFWCHSKSVPRQIRAGVRASARDTRLCLLLSTVLRMCCFLMLIAFSLHCGWYIFRPQVRVAGRKKWKTLLAKSVPVRQERRELSEKLHSELWLWPVFNSSWQIRSRRWCLGRLPTVSATVSGCFYYSTF